MTAQVWAPVALFIGELKPLPPEGQRTGMFKTRQVAPVFCGVEGLRGDQQGDRRVQGRTRRCIYFRATTIVCFPICFRTPR
jgi:MOSC domain-containing protein YiiM